MICDAGLQSQLKFETLKFEYITIETDCINNYLNVYTSIYTMASYLVKIVRHYPVSVKVDAKIKLIFADGSFGNILCEINIYSS